MKHLAIFLFLTAVASAQTIGQYEIRKRGATGFTSYGVTLTDGQVIGQASGVPAAVNVVPYSLPMAALQSLASSPSGSFVYANGLGSYDVADLSNVENTALSTWAGTTNITTLGTISAGTWHGSAIGVSYGGTGATTPAGARVALLPALAGNAGKVLAVNGGATDVEWITGGGGLTIGTTTISGAASADLLTSDGTKLQKLTPGTGVFTFLATPTAANLAAAVSDDDPAFVGTSNTFTAAQTINASSGTNLLDAQSSGVSKFRVIRGGGFEADIDGTNKFTATPYSIFGLKLQNGSGEEPIALSVVSGGGIALGANTPIQWSTNNYATYHIYGSGFIGPRLIPDAANELALRNGPYANVFRVYNTYTSSTSNEAYVIDWKTTSNTCRVGTIKGSGGGTARDLIIQTDGTTRITISSAGEIFMSLPTSAGASGSLWNDSGTVKVSP